MQQKDQKDNNSEPRSLKEVIVQNSQLPKNSLPSKEDIIPPPAVNKMHAPVITPRDNEVTEYERFLNQVEREKRGYAPNPDCTVCHGSGWLYAMERGKPVYNKAIPCNASGCVVDAKKHYKQSGEYLRLRGLTDREQTFETFKKRPGTEEVFKAFYELAHGQTNKPFLFCKGIVGSGKTHLCQALTKVLNERQIETRYYNVYQLMSGLHQSIPDNTTDTWIELLGKIDGLVLDDLGTEYGSDWEWTKLEAIIDQRWQWRRLTVVTTNQSEDFLKEKNDRILDRLLDIDLSTVVTDVASSYRTVR